MALIIHGFDLLVEEVVYLVLGYHFLLEGIRSFIGLHHLHYFGVVFRGATLQGCNGFLSHSILLFDFAVNSHPLQNRVVFLQLQTIWSVLLILGRDVA